MCVREKAKGQCWKTLEKMGKDGLPDINKSSALAGLVELDRRGRRGRGGGESGGGRNCWLSATKARWAS